MMTKTFTAKYLERSEKSVKIEYLGKTVHIPMSQVERMDIRLTRVTLTIAHWVYVDRFEKSED